MKNFEIKSPYAQTEGEQIYGALFLNGKQVSDFGWWPGHTMSEALEHAIWAYNLDRLKVS